MREFCGPLGLSFFLVNDVWVKEFTQKLQAKEIKVKVLLDLTANQTIVINRCQLDTFRITEEIKNKIEVPFVVKPSWGDSGVGVIVDAWSGEDLRKSTELAPYSDSFLIQQQVEPTELGGHFGWFRMFRICREVLPCWWNPQIY